MKALVTGNLGFIGSHLTRRLLDDGWDVVGVDNGCTGSEQNLKRLGIAPGDICQLGGVMDVADIDSSVLSPHHDELASVEAIYHLACPASPVMYQRHAAATYRALCIGTVKLSQLANMAGANLLLASTSETYGEPLVHPQREDYRGNVTTLGPRSLYDEGKRMAEALVYHFCESWTIARIFNTYGPNMAVDDGRLMPNLFTQAISGDDVTVYGDGLQTRAFCFVDDMVGGLMKAFVSPLVLTSDDQGARVFNLGSTDEVSVLSVASKIAYRYDVGIIHEPLPADDPTRRRPDVSRAEANLGWRARVSLDDGLERTREYFESVM